MTTKEKQEELDDILNFKLALHKKIEWNEGELDAINEAILSPEYAHRVPELIKTRTIWEHHLRRQKQEIKKMPNTEIARNLNVNLNIVRYKWETMVGIPRF